MSNVEDVKNKARDKAAADKAASDKAAVDKKAVADKATVDKKEPVTSQGNNSAGEAAAEHAYAKANADAVSAEEVRRLAVEEQMKKQAAIDEARKHAEANIAAVRQASSKQAPADQPYDASIGDREMREKVAAANAAADRAAERKEDAEVREEAMNAAAADRHSDLRQPYGSRVNKEPELSEKTMAEQEAGRLAIQKRKQGG